MRKFVIVIILSAILLIVRSFNANEAGSEIESSWPIKSTEIVDSISTAIDDSSESVEVHTPTNDDFVADDACDQQSRGPEPLASQEDIALYASVQIVGTEVTPYAQLDRASLKQFAGQDESAAMVVLGLLELASAYGFSDINSYSALTSEQFESFRVPLEDISEDASLHIESAKNLYYRAALLGRLTALQPYGATLYSQGETAVSLGWLDEDEFASLEGRERIQWLPQMVYEQVALELAPGLKLTPPYPKNYSPPDDERLRSIVSELANEYRYTLQDSGLASPAVLSAEFASYAAIKEWTCD